MGVVYVRMDFVGLQLGPNHVHIYIYLYICMYSVYIHICVGSIILHLKQLFLLATQS